MEDSEKDEQQWHLYHWPAIWYLSCSALHRDEKEARFVTLLQLSSSALEKAMCEKMGVAY